MKMLAKPMLQVRNFSTGATGSFGNAHSVELRSATSTTTHGVLIHHNENNIARRSLEVADSNGVFATFVQSKVGIGTASPNSKLMVIDTGDARKQIEFGNHVTYRGSIGHDASSGRNEYRTEAGGGMHAFFKGATSTTPEMIIDNNGNVGIGLTNPQRSLHVKMPGGSVIAGNGYDVAIFQNADAAGIRLVDSGDAGGNGGNAGLGNDNGNLNVASAGVLTFSTNLAANAALYGGASTGGTERMRIDASGKVGIGTDNPQNSAKVDIYTSATSGHFNGLQIRRPNSAGITSAMQFTLADSIMVGKIQHDYVASNHNDMSFHLRLSGGSNEEVMRLYAGPINGTRVGIGTTQPTAKLHVAGTIVGNDGTSTKSVHTVGQIVIPRRRFFRHISTGIGDEVVKLMRYGRHWWGTGFFEIIIRGTYYGGDSQYGVFTVNGHTRSGLAGITSHINNTGTGTPYADNYNSTHEACDISIVLPAYRQYNIEFNILHSSRASTEAGVGYHVGNTNSYFLHGTIGEFV